MDLNLKKHKNDLLFLPLGGSNEIGMNLNLYHLDGKWLMVDCGVGFAYDIPGVDVMVPDLSFIRAHKHNLVGLILTHIHEDHMGAVQYLWDELEVPVYATKFGANYLKTKLQEYKMDKRVPIHIIDETRDLNLHPFNIEFIGLTHSVPEMKALIIKTHKGNVLHTGDWKFDPNPVVGEASQKEKIAAYGQKGEILAMVCDSTNVLSAGHSRSEGELYESLKSLIVGRKSLVGVTTFASNIARIHTLCHIARDVGRKVVLAGFSLRRLHEVGKKSGYFLESEIDPSLFISDKEIKFFKKSEIMIIATGCQGEPLAAVKKIANDAHPSIRFVKGDLMIFSSKIIPGNEKKIFALFDDLAKKEIDVMTEQDHFVHVSGHPYQEELREMYDLAKPKIAIPVHGEFVHTKAHCELARACGVDKAIHVENGLAIKIDAENILASGEVGFVKSGYLGVDGNQLIPLNSEVIVQRKKLQSSGMINISFAINDSLKILSKIKINSFGAYNLDGDAAAENMLKLEIQTIVKNKAKELGLNEGFGLRFLKKKNKRKKLETSKIVNEIEKSLRSKLSKIFEDLSGKRANIEFAIHLID
jgi:ribonuclease J